MDSAELRTSVVIPVYNESECIEELHRRLTEVLSARGETYEIVFVDDGSKDGCGEILRRIAASDDRVGVIRFARNFGQHYAMTAGFDHARGGQVVLMDSDLQDRPEDIPLLLDKAAEGYDVVYGVRTARKDPFFRRLSSKGLIWLLDRASGRKLEWEFAVFRVMSRKVIDALCGMREDSRFIAGMVSWLGFPSAHVEVTHEERFAGESKYRFRSLIRLAVTALTGFSVVPLRIATYLGFLVSSFTFVWTVVLLFRRLLFDIMMPGFVSTMVAILFLGGVQLIVLGIIGEYLGRIYTQVQKRPLYVVAERIGAVDGHDPGR